MRARSPVYDHVLAPQVKVLPPAVLARVHPRVEPRRQVVHIDARSARVGLPSRAKKKPREKHQYSFARKAACDWVHGEGLQRNDGEKRHRTRVHVGAIVNLSLSFQSNGVGRTSVRSLGVGQLLQRAAGVGSGQRMQSGTRGRKTGNGRAADSAIASSPRIACAARLGSSGAESPKDWRVAA
eukprot:980547-Pleurochrysis_carterae.AAC.1